MNQQPDKLFRDKLFDYQKSVSSDLWSRIPASRGTQAHPKLWLKMAAGLLLLATASILIFPRPRKTEPLTAQMVEPSTKLQPSNEEKPISEHNPISDIEVEKTPSVRDHDKVPSQRRGEEVSVSGSANVRQGALAETVSTLGLKDEIIETGILPGPEESLAREQKSEDTRVTIIFTVDEVNEKYLKKKNTTAEATSDGKGTSGLRKLLDKASDLTTNQDPLGSLRQKKNEILALNLRGGKGRNENHE